MTTGERIRTARKARGMTQANLGEICGIAESTIRRYELDKLHPKIETLEKIANALQMDVNVLRDNLGNCFQNRDSGKPMGEYSTEFDRLRQARVNASFYKYGPARKNFGEGRVDALATAKRCLDAFEKDHNLEHLLDAANYLMFRWMYPMPGDFFQPTDSDGSVGTVGTPINMERGEYQ